MSFLRKQESRLVPAQAGIQAIHFSYSLDFRFRRNDILQPASLSAGLSRQGRGKLHHSAKMLRIFAFGWEIVFRWGRHQRGFCRINFSYCLTVEG